MKNRFAVQQIQCQIGTITTTCELEQALYLGKFQVDQQEHLTISLDEWQNDCVWVVDPEFQVNFGGQMPTNRRHIIPASSHWLSDAIQFAGLDEGQYFRLAAAHANRVIVLDLERNAPQTAWGWLADMDLSQPGQSIRNTVWDCGLVEWLWPGNSQEPDRLLNEGCALDRNPYPQQSAFSELFQCLRAILSVRNRCHYAVVHPHTSGNLRQYSLSVPWLLGKGQSVRQALLLAATTKNNSWAIHVVEAETSVEIVYRGGDDAPQLFILAGNTVEDIHRKIERVRSLINEGSSLARLSALLQESHHLNPAMRLVLIASTADELEKECAAAVKGLPGAAAGGKEWQSLNGSFFTPQPLGEEAGVTLVYPGAFNSYVGMGRELLHSFPALQDWFDGRSSDPAEFYQADKIFPPALGAASEKEKQQMQENLVASPLSMLFSGTAIAGLYTHLLRRGFGIEVKGALGYSMGETSMLFATGFWSTTDAIKDEIAGLPLFQRRLAGQLDAVREHWLAQGESVPDGSAPIWDNYILMTTFEKALPVVSAEPQVYLTHTNAPRQLIIGGEPAGCRRVLEQLKCMSFPIPYHYPMHCAAIISEYETLRDLHMQPVERYSQLTYYSSYTIAPMTMESSQIADAIAGGLCNRVDFPALVKAAYADGSRIFIEVGARSNCTKWVESTLKGEAFCALSINQAEVPDLMGVLRVLARLISHGKKVDFRMFCSNPQNVSTANRQITAAELPLVVH